MLIADLNFFSPNISRISSAPSIILGSAGIPDPFATLSFFEKDAAILEAAVTAAAPRVCSRFVLAVSSSPV